KPIDSFVTKRIHVEPMPVRRTLDIMVPRTYISAEKEILIFDSMAYPGTYSDGTPIREMGADATGALRPLQSEERLVWAVVELRKAEIFDRCYHAIESSREEGVYSLPACREAIEEQKKAEWF